MVYKFKFNWMSCIFYLLNVATLLQKLNHSLEWSLDDQANIDTKGREGNQVEGHLWK